MLFVLGKLFAGENICVNTEPNPKTLPPVPRNNPQGRILFSLSLRTPKCCIQSKLSSESNLVGPFWSALGFCRRDKGGGVC